METPHGHAKIKVSEAADIVNGLQGTPRFGGRCSCHVTASLTHLHCSSSAGRPSRRGRPTRPHGQPRASGTHPPLHPLELSPTSSGWPAEPSSAAAARSGCSVREGGVWGSERLGADALRALRAAAARDPLQHACVCRCGRRLPVLVGVVGRCLRCACCVRSDACWRGCAGLCMVSMAG